MLYMLNMFFFNSYSRGAKYISELPPLTPNQKKESQIPKYLNAIFKGGANVSSGVQLGVERPIGDFIA